MNPFLFVPDDIDADWRSRARCVGLHELFDPPVDRSPEEQARVHAARTVCRRCTVTAPCIESAKEHHDSGVRGGVLMVDGQPSPWPRDGAA